MGRLYSSSVNLRYAQRNRYMSVVLWNSCNRRRYQMKCSVYYEITKDTNQNLRRVCIDGVPLQNAMAAVFPTADSTIRHSPKFRRSV